MTRPLLKPVRIGAGYRITFGKEDKLLRVSDESGTLLEWPPNGAYKISATFIKDEVSFREFIFILAALNRLSFREFTPSSPKLWGYEFHW